MPSLAEQAKKLLQQGFAAEAQASPKCRLCRLAGEQKEALELLLASRRDTGKPTFAVMQEICAKLGIKTSNTSLSVHYERHWDGKDKAKAKSR